MSKISQLLLLKAVTMLHIDRRKLLLTSLITGLSARAVAAGPLRSSARILVGFTPGSGPDLVARRLSHALTGQLAKTVIVENRSGAGGNIAISAGLMAPPDGTNLILCPSGILTVNPHTYKRLPFNPLEDLAPVSLVCRYELGFAVGPAVPDSVKSLSTFTAWVHQQKKTVVYGSPAAGSGLHFMAHEYSRQLKLGMMHVPYRGASNMVADILGGQIAAGAGSLPALMAHAGQGRLRVLACTGNSRSSLFPEVQTYEEQGVSGLGMREWHGIYVDKKTDAETVSHLNHLVSAAVRTPEFIESMKNQGFQAIASKSQDLDALARSDASRWGALIAKSGFEQTS